DVIAAHGIGAKKSLGQNFLLDFNLTMKIARAGGDLAQVTVVEIGPGPGGLTRALLAAGAAKVVAIERDRRCLSALEQVAERYRGRLEVIEADALTIDWTKVTDGRARIIANLPYNVATPLLAGWLTADPWPPWYDCVVAMFQKEVAQRVCAGVGDKAYGRLSVLTGWRTDAQALFDVPAAAFTPPPKVTSSLVRLIPRREPLACDIDKLQAITRAAFGQRRKMLRSSLKSLGGQALLERAGIDGSRRAEELSVEEFVTLANRL
ncbi:MAG: 16S rRNA (adenine(1518)-N(6)/adenine(1519)-N(6))-dimethyltransferase RsmA, partial [Proteobacteria bacterium]|nr:16S rRNA (adenine(1518)-N(6)/adenine(1519)-N(6))-dimethyltransferase RsmA [Pseudomonadota bacterium]